MTSQEVTGLIGALGFPIFIVLAGIYFVLRHFWPWYVQRVDRRDTVEKERHAEFMNVIREFSLALQAVNVTMSSTAQQIAALTDRIDDHHVEIMNEIKNHNGHNGDKITEDKA